MRGLLDLTLACPLGHGLFLSPAGTSVCPCPLCGSLLIAISDDTPNRIAGFQAAQTAPVRMVSGLGNEPQPVRFSWLRPTG